jgi:hypothetical protein
MKTSRLEFRKRITSYAYPRNGNTGNPTPRVGWECWEVFPHNCERLVDHAPLLRILRAEYPEGRIAPRKP